MAVIVPRVSEGAVAPQSFGIPGGGGPRVTAEGLDGGVSQTLTGAAGMIFDLQQKEQAKANAAQANAARIALSQQEVNLFDPNNADGVYSHHGSDALKAPGAAALQMDDFAAKYRANLTNPQQVAQFDALYADHRLQIVDRVNRYALGENDKYQAQAYDGAVGSALSSATSKAASGDMDGANLALNDGIATIRQYGAAHGEAADMTAFKIEKFTKAVRAGFESANKANAEAYILQAPQQALQDFSARLQLGRYSSAGQAFTADPKAPRGIRNNNPGNLQQSDVEWQGKVASTDLRYESFATPEAGIRALALNAQHLQANGAQSVTDLISKWSPAAENGKAGTEAYIADVAKSMGVSPTDNIDLQDPAQLTAFTNAVINHENGGNPYTPDQVALGVKAATGGAKLPETHPLVAMNGSGIIVPGQESKATSGDPGLDANYSHNLPFAKPGPYVTKLDPEQESQFEQWVKKNNINFDPSAKVTDYDMRGFWLSQQGKAGSGTEINALDGKIHYPDTYKTPYDRTFSNESKYATQDAPHWKDDRYLVDGSGKVVFDQAKDSEDTPYASTPRSSQQIGQLGKSGNPMVDALDTASTVDLYNLARAEVNRGQVSLQSSIAQRERDDTAAFRAGQGVAQPLTLADYTRAYGDREGMQRYGAYQADKQLGHDLQTVATLTPQQMQDLLAARAPAPGENFAIKQQDHTALQSAIAQTLKARQTDPVAWARQAGVGDFQPLEVDSPDQLAGSIAARVGPARALRDSLGTPYKLLSTDEAKALGASFNAFSAANKAAALGDLSQQLPAAEYSQVVTALKDKSPTVAIAGRIMGNGRLAQVGTTGSLWWKSPVMMDAADIAQTMLRGDALLNPTAADKETGGAAKFAMPSDSATSGLRSVWSDVVGDAYRGDGTDEAQAYQAFRAMYAGLASQAGKNDGILDSSIADKAARAVIGNVVDWNNKNVLPPYGMDGNVFKDAAAKQWDGVRANVPGADQQDLDSYDLDRLGEGVYAVSNGQAPLRDKEGRPVILRIAPPAAEPTKPEPFKPAGTLRIGAAPEQGGALTAPTADQLASMR